MDNPVVRVIARSARASALFAGILAAAFVVLALLSKIPLVGPVFFCLNFLLSLAAYFAVGYFTTPRVRERPPGTTDPLLALYIGAGVAIAVTLGFLVGGAVSGLFDLIADAVFSGSSNAFGSAVTGLFRLIITLIVYAIYGLIVGGLLAFLGSFLSLSRSKS
jgi:hypothetical protein